MRTTERPPETPKTKNDNSISQIHICMCSYCDLSCPGSRFFVLPSVCLSICLSIHLYHRHQFSCARKYFWFIGAVLICMGASLERPVDQLISGEVRPLYRLWSTTSGVLSFVQEPFGRVVVSRVHSATSNGSPSCVASDQQFEYLMSSVSPAALVFDMAHFYSGDEATASVPLTERGGCVRRSRCRRCRCRR